MCAIYAPVEQTAFKGRKRGKQRWSYLYAVWIISSKVFPVFYRVVFVNGREEGVLQRARQTETHLQFGSQTISTDARGFVYVAQCSKVVVSSGKSFGS